MASCSNQVRCFPVWINNVAISVHIGENVRLIFNYTLFFQKSLLHMKIIFSFFHEFQVISSLYRNKRSGRKRPATWSIQLQQELMESNFSEKLTNKYLLLMKVLNQQIKSTLSIMTTIIRM